MRLRAVVALCMLLTGCGAGAQPARDSSTRPSESEAARPACPVLAQPVSTRFDLPHARAAIATQRRLAIVAIGSSSTSGDGASAPHFTYPAVLRADLARALPGVSVEVHNRGVSGQDAAENMARFQQDVFRHRPNLVIWQVGAIAALRNLDAATFRVTVVDGVKRLRAASMDVILMDNQRAPAIQRNPQWETYEQALRDVARETGANLFPRGALMAAWEERGEQVSSFVGWDGLHHTDRGYVCMADALAAAILTEVAPKVAGSR